MTREELDKDMIESIEMWLHEIEPKWVEKELTWLDELRTRLIEEETPNDLEEAANEYAYRGMPDEMKPYVKPIGDEVIKNFISGAKWQKEQDDKLVDIIYRQGIEKGKDDMKEQMVKEAVEGYVVKDITGSLAVTAKGINLDGFKFGQKVRIIIVKEGEK